ncbi:MAG: hypothetical protein ACI4PK_02480 [Oscillospiraceae bacterium]
MPVVLSVNLDGNITVTEELACEVRKCIIVGSKTISRGADYKGCLFSVKKRNNFIFV